jgi:hypothetical protein
MKTETKKAVNRLAHYVEAAANKTLPADKDAAKVIASVEADGITGKAEASEAVADRVMKFAEAATSSPNREVAFSWSEGQGKGSRYYSMQSHVARFVVHPYTGIVSAYWSYCNRCGSEWRLMDGLVEPSYNDKTIAKIVEKVQEAFNRNPERMRVDVEEDPARA